MSEAQLDQCDQLDRTNEYLAYRHQLERWTLGQITDEREIAATSHEMCLMAKRLGCRPEEILAGLRLSGLKPVVIDGPERWQKESQWQDRRYAEAIGLMLRIWFATGDQDEAGVRTVLGTDGRTWYVYVVVAAKRFGAAKSQRRRNWLCLETGIERRYISPVPRGWTGWSDAVLREEIRRARPDLRG